MKRKVIIATVTAAALVGGGTATAFGVAGSGGDSAEGKPASSSQSHTRSAGHDDDLGDGHDDDRGDRHDRAADGKDGEDGKDGDRADKAEDTGAADVSFARAAQSVLEEVPGSITELELDTDHNTLVWEADVLGKDGKWHEVKIDAAKGDVVTNRVDTHKDDDRSVARAAKLDAAEVGKKAADATKGATVTSVSLEDDADDGAAKGHWEAETVDKQGTEHELVLDGASGKVLDHESDQGDDD
ncbi:PepSY domain-containing protein [Streptomyces tubbatahanensis]|uniref:PepSY domain-containing protein n=1 Tax=Streptomyces tubbatahanensis TaxID=2923272 RepID=A0ABY3XX00_9ACTN|nr:PepSY domain-containing protein [Streptomyces tubbatahanensis]UNS99031.1 PepSY domain-containing protein [Streptomyces tubbatahanensis]